MRTRAVLFSAIAVSLCVAGAQAATDMQTIITNIKNNTVKITSYSAAFTLQEDTTGMGGTGATSCVPRNITWEFSRPDTVIFSVQKDTGWIHHNSILGGNGEEFPKYQAIVMLNLLADTFPNSWINVDIPTFTAHVDSEYTDSIVIMHMNSSVAFTYTVDKKRWLVTRVVAGGYDVYDVTYTWGTTAGGIYYPSAITINDQSNLCKGKSVFTNVKVNGVAVSSAVLPRNGNVPFAAGRGYAVSIALTSAPGGKVMIPLPYGEIVRSLSITDVSGRTVQKLTVNSDAFNRDRTVLWDGRDLHSRQIQRGVYFATITTDRASVSAKLPIVK